VEIQQKSAYHAKYLRMSWTYLDLLYRLLVGMIFQIFIWWSTKRRCHGRCYGNQLNMGDVRKYHMERINSLVWHSTKDWLIINPLSKGSIAIIRLHHVQIWLAFPNGLEDCNFDFSRVIGNHFCTSCRNLVRFGTVTPEFKR